MGSRNMAESLNSPSRPYIGAGETIRIFEEQDFQFAAPRYLCRPGENEKGMFATAVMSHGDGFRSETAIGLTHDEDGSCSETIIIADQADRANRIVLARKGEIWLYALYLGATVPRWFSCLMGLMNIKSDAVGKEGLPYCNIDGFLIILPELLQSAK
jgi:hypothetical protein